MKYRTLLFAFLFMGSFMVSCSSEAQSSDQETPQSGNTDQAPAADEAQKASILEDVGVDRFEELISEEGMQILDVRTPGEWAEGYVEGATRINVHDDDFAEQVKNSLDPSKSVTVYCKAGGRSAKASSILQENGFEKIYNYTGGMSEWYGLEKPTVKE